jgi:glycosyltransferase involved in cell wall biosynthesis
LKSKVSIIIPNYNNEQWLPLCLESCLTQFGDFELEVIVVDDHSTDKSWEVLQAYQKEYPEIIKVVQNTSKGGNQARNYGFSLSTGDYIQWLDSDDQLLMDKLETQLNFFKKNRAIDIAYSDWRMDFYEEGEKVKEEIKLEKNYDSFLENLIKDNWQPPLSYLLRRSMAERLHQLQAWNPKRKVGQDREYYSLAAIYGASFGYVSGLFSVYNRWSKQSVSSMEHKKRLKHSLYLEQRLMHEIQKQKWISKKQKKKMIASLKTDALKACFYDPTLRLLEPISFTEIRWGRVHYKMRLLIPFIWLYQMVNYNVMK